MATLIDILKITRNIQYRVYVSNRDCLIFESFFEHHSSYVFGTFDVNTEYYGDNRYCDFVESAGYKNVACDTETKEFLDYFGDYEVCCLEIGSFIPTNRYAEPAGTRIAHVGDSANCLNIFIFPKGSVDGECSRCYRAAFDTEGGLWCRDESDPRCSECRGRGVSK